MSTALKSVLAAAFSLAALSACTVNTVPPVATTGPTPVIVQQPAPAATTTVVTPRAY